MSDYMLLALTDLSEFKLIYILIKDLGILTSYLLYITDYPYTKRFNNIKYLEGYNTLKASELFSNNNIEDIL